MCVAKWHLSRSTPVRVIRNGVDRRPRTRSRAPGTARLLDRRDSPRRSGIDHLPRSFALLREEHPEARLTLAGTGPEDVALRGLAADLGLGAAATFVGHVDPAPLLADADVLVQLSVWENCSYSLLDALVHGLGAVASPVGGTLGDPPPGPWSPRRPRRRGPPPWPSRGRGPRAARAPDRLARPSPAMGAAIAEVYARVGTSA